MELLLRKEHRRMKTKISTAIGNSWASKVMALIAIWSLGSQAIAASIDLAILKEIDLHQPIKQFRAVPVNLGNDRPPAVAALYGEDAEIDPYIGMFFFPKSTLKLIVFDVTGHIHWKRDLGPGVVPGIWFCPLFAFDTDGNGIDELYFVNNMDPEHPLDYRQYVLQQVEASTGLNLNQQPWPQPKNMNSMSHTYRHFIVGGMVNKRPIVVAIQGTYGTHVLHAFGPDLKPLWQVTFDPEKVGGSLGSHVTPVVDINNDGSDELFVGERCLSLRDGKELFCCDRDAWRGHSDIIQPVYNKAGNRWNLWTCRESFENSKPRLAFFDDQGQILWSAVDTGHMDTGWAARLGSGGEPVVLGVKVGRKVRTAEGERRTGVEEYAFEAFSGKRWDLGFNAYTTIPVDLNGDGVHELVKGYFEGDGSVIDCNGKAIGNIGGLSAIHSHFSGKAGEQILSYHPDGKVRIWHDRNAVDTPAAKARYQSHFYQINQKLSGVGYNLFNLGGI